VVGAILALAAGALAFAFFAWPRGSLEPDAAALARLQRPALGEAGLRVSVHDADGKKIPVVLRAGGRIWPSRPVAPGTRLTVEVVFRRPGWVGWIAGRRQTARLDLTAPSAHVEQRWLRVKAGAPVRVRFDHPVRRVELTGVGARRLLRLQKPTRTVALGRLGEAGSVGVSALARTWEELPPPTSVTWFPHGGGAKLLVSPRAGSELRLNTPLRLRFSQPVRTLLHRRQPARLPAIPGRWQTLDAHTVVFRPHGYGFGLARSIRLRLPVPVERIGGAARPARTVAWETPTPSTLRLQQLLALEGYLPVRWTPAAGGDAARTIRDQVAAAVHPPGGTFDWRFPNTPPELQALWRPGEPNEITRGAVMMFQDEHHLDVDALAGGRVWQALIADAIAGKRRTSGYSYVYVHRSVPQSLNLWHNGSTILSSPGNTGVPEAPTQLGTFPVFEHIPVGTMSGTNPDGSHYNDPGVRYISYFNGGDAIHAFNRSSFGTPQSLGCVELPLAAAAKVWPYTPIGTLVTIEN
jgi:hypothetical protein